MIDYVMLLTAALLFSLQIIFTKRFQTKHGNSLGSASCFSIVSGLGCFVIMLFVSGFKFAFTPFSFIMALLVAFTLTLVDVVGVKAISKGSLSVYTLFLMMGGMMIPFLVGVVFLKEEISILHVIGLVLLIIALFLPIIKTKNNQNQSKITLAFIALCSVVFIFNGLNGTFGKLHQIGSQAITTAQFLVYVALFKILFGCLFLAFSKESGKLKILTDKETVISGLGFALVHVVASFLQLLAALNVKASLLYPLVTGGTIVFAPLCALVLYKDKPDKKTIACIVISLIATILFAF